MARFLLNTMLASGNYPWTVIPVERRDDYMKALEEASVNYFLIDAPKGIPLGQAAGNIILGIPRIPLGIPACTASLGRQEFD